LLLTLLFRGGRIFSLRDFELRVSCELARGGEAGDVLESELAGFAGVPIPVNEGLGAARMDGDAETLTCRSEI